MIIGRCYPSVFGLASAIVVFIADTAYIQVQVSSASLEANLFQLPVIPPVQLKQWNLSCPFQNTLQILPVTDIILTLADLFPC